MERKHTQHHHEKHEMKKIELAIEVIITLHSGFTFCDGRELHKGMEAIIGSYLGSIGVAFCAQKARSILEKELSFLTDFQYQKDIENFKISIKYLDQEGINSMVKEYVKVFKLKYGNTVSLNIK
jgi:hypothetical protein